MWASPGCDMAGFHASYGAKANLELMKLARSVTVNLCVISARANYPVLSVTAMHRREGDGSGWVAAQSIARLGKYQQSRAVSLGLHPDTFPPSRCHICASSLLSWEHSERGDCGVVEAVPIQAAQSGGRRARLAARPLHGDSAGFNYPQLCFISLPSWAPCPSVLCKYAAFTLKSRWDTQASERAHIPSVHRLKCGRHRGNMHEPRPWTQ